MKTNAYFDPLVGGKTTQSNAFWKAYRAWAQTNNPAEGHFITDDDSEVVMDDFTWDNERQEFLDALRKAGVRTMIVTNRSTALMEDIHGYVALGCEMLGLCKAKMRGVWSNEEPVIGIRFKL
jgi:hypothetical protein